MNALEISQTLDAESFDMSESTDGFDMPALGMTDFFAGDGHKKLVIMLLKSAVDEIVKDPESARARADMLWLQGRNDNPLTAQMLIESVSGPNETGLAKLMEKLETEPELLQSALSTALLHLDYIDRPDEDDAMRLSSYRSMAHAH